VKLAICEASWCSLFAEHFRTCPAVASFAA
jgi:hypothetical protein